MLALPLIAMSGAWANGATEGYLPGKFSVSADKQVYFSKGNLQATTTDKGANWTWAFAEHQWDYIGNAAANTAINGNGTVSENGTVDLFGWVGASSNFTGGAMYGISNSETLNNVNGYGNVKKEPMKSDWGNVFGADSPWRTPTGEEWRYIFDARETESGIRYAKAQVNGVNGVILVPDDWSTSTYNLQSTNANVAFTTNTIDATTWSSTLEPAGAVFLPAAGIRSRSSVGGMGECYYWSSESLNYTTYGAYHVYIDIGNVFSVYTNQRNCGFSVRLVCTEIDQTPKISWDAANKQGTFTMPAGNVEVSVEYYQPAELAWKQGTAAVPEGGVSAYKGFPTTLPALANPNSHTVSYASTNTDVATIDADGKITLVGAGTTTIQAIFAGDDTYEDKTASYTLNVFLPATLTLKSNNDAWGTVTAEGASDATSSVTAIDNGNGTYSIIPGTEVTAKATPADGYHLDCWSNNAEVNDAGTQTFTMGEDDMELTAFFEDNTPTNVATFAAANVFTIEGGKAVVKVNADARPLNENQELNVKAGSTITIEAIPGYKIKSVNVKPASHAPEGALPGLFSVSDTKQVYFAKGNLVATTADFGANWTWSFAESQWEWVANINKTIKYNAGSTTTANGNVTYFCWVGASGSWNTGGARYGIVNDNHDKFGKKNGEFLIADWGELIGDGWYTLSGAEWAYLVGESDARNGKCGLARIHNRFGLIILPDSYTDPKGVETPFVSGKDAVTTYSDDDWTLMEAAGAVFLAANGYYLIDTTEDSGVRGNYWAKDSSGGTGYANDLYFSSQYKSIGCSQQSRNYGASVRLVYYAGEE